MNDPEQDVRGQSWRALLLAYASIQFVVLIAIGGIVGCWINGVPPDGAGR